MAAEVDLLILGDVNPDLLCTGDVVPAFGQSEQLLDRAELTVGGSGAITACGAARLGLRVAIVGVVGDDPLGAFMRGELLGRGVDVDALVVEPDLPTGLTVVLSRGEDRASLTLPGATAALRPEHVSTATLGRARHVHVSQYFVQDALRPGLPAILEAAHAAGATTSLDPNGDPRGAWDAGIGELLPYVDVFLPNEAEAAAIGGSDDPATAARALGAALVVVKRGPGGAIAVREDEVVQVPGLRVDAVDATGAGDSFDAGFITAHLDGRPLEEALRFAVVCGALSTRALGGVGAQPTREEVERSGGSTG